MFFAVDERFLTPFLCDELLSIRMCFQRYTQTPAYRRCPDVAIWQEVESLESRTLLAGILQVLPLASGGLLLSGDASDNAARIEIRPDNGLFITGLRGTQLQWQGETLSELSLPAPTALNARLRAGSDWLDIAGESVLSGSIRSASIVAGPGDDSVQISRLTFDDRLTVDMGKGQDSVQLHRVEVASTLRVALRDGDDHLEAANIASGGTIQVQTGSGDDSLQVNHRLDGNRTRIDLGAGDDTVRLGDARLGVEIESTIRLGAGSDELISLSPGNLAATRVAAGPGDDRFLGQAEPEMQVTGFEQGAGESPTRGPIEVALDPIDAAGNTRLIESYVLAGKQVLIPAGSWPVRPISIGSYGGIVGQGAGVSELRLEITTPTRYDPQHVLATAVPEDPSQFTRGVVVKDLTLDGNFQNIQWDEVYGDGNGFGLYVRAAADSVFKGLEIKNQWTDGIFVSTVLGHANNSKNCVFEQITIHHCGRQGVSLVGGEHLRFNEFVVHAIGRTRGLDRSPRSALDMEPEPGVQRLVRHITVSNWNIRNVGQGILVSTTHSSAPAQDILIRDITIEDANGPQLLAVRDARNVNVRNFHARNHVGGGVGVLFRNTIGVVTNLSIIETQGTNFPLRIDGTSQMVLRQITLDNAERGALQIGGEPGDLSQATHVELTDFSFRNLGRQLNGLPLVRIHSTGTVTLTRGTISDIGNARYTAQLFTDTSFDQCDFQPGSQGLFDPTKSGQATGEGNSWN